MTRTLLLVEALRLRYAPRVASAAPAASFSWATRRKLDSDSSVQNSRFHFTGAAALSFPTPPVIRPSRSPRPGCPLPLDPTPGRSSSAPPRKRCSPTPLSPWYAAGGVAGVPAGAGAGGEGAVVPGGVGGAGAWGAGAAGAPQICAVSSVLCGAASSADKTLTAVSAPIRPSARARA